MIHFRIPVRRAARWAALSAAAVVPVVASAHFRAAGAQPEAPVNINTATVEELVALPRIGKVTATRIVEWREENGPFARTEELMNVQGIGERVYERIKPHVTVGDPPAEQRPAPFPAPFTDGTGPGAPERPSGGPRSARA